MTVNGQLGKRHFDNKGLVAPTFLTTASDPGQKELFALPGVHG